MKYTKARYVFLVYISCCIAFLAASVTQRSQTGIGKCTSLINPSTTRHEIQVLEHARAVTDSRLKQLCFL